MKFKLNHIKIINYIIKILLLIENKKIIKVFRIEVNQIIKIDINILILFIYK